MENTYFNTKKGSEFKWTTYKELHKSQNMCETILFEASFIQGSNSKYKNQKAKYSSGSKLWYEEKEHLSAVGNIREWR